MFNRIGRNFTFSAFKTTSFNRLLFRSSSSSPAASNNSFAVSYLIHSCGFPPDKAISASNYLKFKTPDRADAMIAFFKNQGFTEPQISHLVSKQIWLMYSCCKMLACLHQRCWHVLTYQTQDLLVTTKQLKTAVEEVVEMGFDPLKTKKFMLAVYAVRSLSKSTWEKKMETYQKWGWSKSQILLAFRANPWCMVYSEDKVEKVMDFSFLTVWRKGLFRDVWFTNIVWTTD